jgi:hypothetical protein
VEKQKFNLPVTYNGLTWDPRGTRFYASGGVQDIVCSFKKMNGAFTIDPPHHRKANYAAKQPRRDGAWWADATRQFNCKKPDALDATAFNRVLWRGIKGDDKPYPSDRTGKEGEPAEACRNCEPKAVGIPTISRNDKRGGRAATGSGSVRGVGVGGHCRSLQRY